MFCKSPAHRERATEVGLYLAGGGEMCDYAFAPLSRILQTDHCGWEQLRSSTTLTCIRVWIIVSPMLKWHMNVESVSHVLSATALNDRHLVGAALSLSNMSIDARNVTLTSPGATTLQTEFICGGAVCPLYSMYSTVQLNRMD